MKKIMAILTILMCFASTNAFAQLKEVRGVETKRVVYDGGSEYSYHNWDSGRDEKSNKYYGWEFKNLNSCAVSVDITLYKNAYIKEDAYKKESIYIPETIIATKTVVLQSEEVYTFKHEINGTKVFISYNEGKWVDGYHIVYKAFKLQ